MRAKEFIIKHKFSRRMVYESIGLSKTSFNLRMKKENVYLSRIEKNKLLLYFNALKSDLDLCIKTLL